ncbi:MAG: hypothetical protein K5668_06745 [Lachnospiraceae bacterium]|nr:hypothetical protein [Lachnospiraceae bacterium]
MRLRNRRAIALALTASLVFSMNSVSFADEIVDGDIVYEEDASPEEVGVLSADEEAVDEVSDAAELYDTDYETEDEGALLFSEDEEENDAYLASDINAENALSGNVTIRTGTPDVHVSANNTVSVDDVKKAVFEKLEFTMGDNSYYVKKNSNSYSLIKTTDDTVVSTDFTADSANISLNSIRKAASPLKEATEISYTDASKGIISAKGNQLVHYTATINKKVIPGAKECNTVEGDILLKVWTSGTVSSQRVKFADGKFSVVVEYDACVEYRGTKVTATSHHLAVSSDDLSKEVTGTVDGAVGVAVRLEKLSANGAWIPMEGKSYGNYFWKDRTGITIKKPKVYNASKVGNYYDDDGPYFIIPVSYKKKQMANDLLTSDQKLSLKNALASTKIHFTIEPRKLSTELITYDKYDPGKYYVKKLTYNSDKNTLKGTIQYRTLKTNKSTLNVRKLRNMGKKLKVVSKSAYDLKGEKKNDAYFEYSSEKGGATLTGINGYYGTAFIKGSKINVK